MKKVLLITLFFIIAFVDSSIGLNEKINNDSTKPNIILITSDQLIPFLMGTYGHTEVKTPNLDQLAENGILFDNAYTPNPICAPARASLMTGRYTSNIEVWDNAAPLHSDIPTICHYLSSVGYESVLSGKMHFVGPDQMHGYDIRLIPSIYPADFVWTKSRFNKEPRSHARNYQGEAIRIMPEGVDLRRNSTNELTFVHPGFNFAENQTSVSSGFNETSHNSQFDKWAHFKAIEYLQQKSKTFARGNQKPFFLTVSYNFPHEPFFPPKELYDLYENAVIELPVLPDTLNQFYSVMDQWLNRHHGLEQIDVKDPESIKKVRKAYYALVTYVDIMVGELVDALEKNGFADNTIILFTSDHGDMLLEKGMVQKRTFYEWSSRVPMIIKYPDTFKKGLTISQPVSLIDILPTILDWANVPQTSRLEIDGKSMIPLIEGTEQEERYVISEMHSEGVYTPCFMVRKGDFKYNYFHGYGSQLFNMAEDPDEWHNLSGQLEYIELEEDMRDIIYSHFDVEKIDEEVESSIKRRLLIQPVLEKQNINWYYTPLKQQNQ